MNDNMQCCRMMINKTDSDQFYLGKLRFVLLESDYLSSLDRQQYITQQLLSEHSEGFYQLLFSKLPSFDKIDSFVLENRSQVVFPSSRFLFWTRIRQKRGKAKDMRMRNIKMHIGYMVHRRSLSMIIGFIRNRKVSYSPS